MALFEKIVKFFKKPAFEAPSAPEIRPVPVPAAIPPAAKPAMPTPPAAAQPTLAASLAAPKADTLTLKELFLEELRSIPVRHSTAETAREDLLKELKRLTPPGQDRLS